MSIDTIYPPLLSRVWALYSQFSVEAHILIIVFYVVLVRLFRYRRAHSNTKTLRTSPEHDDDNGSSVRRAQIVYRSLINSEFPFFFVKGIQLALFRTYAIPTISSLLNKTTLLSSKSSIARRYSETWALFNEFALADWGSERWIQAMGRTRAIHAAYRKSGKVLNEDMLYTLAALATQPVRLINTWEWRELTDAELCAIGTLYQGLAEAFDLDWRKHFADMAKEDKANHEASQLGEVSISLTRTDSTDSTSRHSGLDFFHSIYAWQELYESRAMKHTSANHHLAATAIDLLLWGVPGDYLKRVATRFLVVLMDDPLRIAVGYPAPTAIYRVCVKTLLVARKFALRHLFLPRFFAIQPTRVVESDISNQQANSPHGALLQHHSRTVLTSYVGAPYYVKPTLWNRWGPGAWWWWFLGHPIPAQDNQHFIAEGYLIPEIGPRLGKTATIQAREEQAVRALLSCGNVNKD
ncbi:hypothetical protein Hte_005657 [Hypoxylon texense]